MGIWIDVAPNQRIQLLPNDSPGPVEILWEHDCLPGYPVPRHLISSTGPHWTVVSRDPLTLSPSVHCDASLGGCGLHGFIREGRYA